MSYGPRPQVDVEHLGELSSYINRNEPVPPELVAKCRRAGEVLVRTEDAGWGWTTLVACAAATWDVDEAKRLSARAINALGPQPALLCNLAISFKHLCRLDLSLELSRQALAVAPSYFAAVKCLCDDLFTSGRFSEGLALAQSKLHLSDSDSDGNGSIVAFAENFERVVKELARASVNEEQVQREMAIAMQVLADARQRYDSFFVASESEPEDGSYSLVAEIRFFGTLDEEMRLGSMLAPRLAELPSWDPCSLNTGFRYQLPEHADVAA